MRADITMNDIDVVTSKNRLITQKSKGHNVKQLFVSFDKGYIIMFNGNEMMKTFNKIHTMDSYNDIKLK